LLRTAAFWTGAEFNQVHSNSVPVEKKLTSAKAHTKH